MADDPVNPKHYVGVTRDGVELQAADVGEAFNLNHHLSTTVEYCIRAGKKPGQDKATDLRKARWWLDREIAGLPAENGTEGDQPDAIDRVLAEVRRELERAMGKFPPIRSVHEGLAIIREEFDELWEAAKRRDPDPADLRSEAIQLGAMAVRFMVDLLSDPAPDRRDLFTRINVMAGGLSKVDGDEREQLVKELTRLEAEHERLARQELQARGS
jgi:hypothetical protein